MKTSKLLKKDSAAWRKKEISIVCTRNSQGQDGGINCTNLHHLPH